MMTSKNKPDDLQIVRYKEKGERFYTRLRKRIHSWLEKNLSVDQKVREYLLLLPDLFVLLVRLISDTRIELKLRLQLLLALVYVMSPIDLIPDIVLPIGFLDDTVAVVFVLTRLINIMGAAGENILNEHWEGDGNLLDKLQKLSRDADKLLSSGFIARLRELFLNQ
jgi:uncharacterized membrane protein YkvA (DUF1232 family)